MGAKQSQASYSYDFAQIGEKVPMIEFLDSLHVKERAKVFAYMEKLVELKNAELQPKENLSKHLTEGIFEMRVTFESRIARVLYFYEVERKVIFSHGFVKKSQKTPAAEISRALTIRKMVQGA